MGFEDLICVARGGAISQHALDQFTLYIVLASFEYGDGIQA